MNARKRDFKSLLAGAGDERTGSPAALAVPTSTVTDGADFREVDACVEEQMRRLNIPGASLAIVQDKEIVHLRGFGCAHPGGQAPTPQTPFSIGSLAKSFTALAVMQLVEAGKVELDAPVQRYLPWFRVADPQASAEMTVRHLLNQTSGLPVLAGEVGLANLDDSPDAVERQVRELATLRVSGPAGAKFSYSNLNYNVLGLVVEVASGEPYVDYIQRHVFDPLEMSHSYTSKADAKRGGLAMGYRHWFGHPFPAPGVPVPRGSLPSGQLFSSSEDMAHYLIAHINGGRYGDARILSEAGVHELHRGVEEYVLLGKGVGRYGMGWYERDVGGITAYAHAGNVPEFSAFMAIIPEKKRGVALLFNADPYGLPPITEEVGMAVTTLLAGQQPAPIRLGFVQWTMRLLPLIPLAQAAGVLATVRALDAWGSAEETRPSRRRLWGRHILLPLIPNLSLSAVAAYLHISGVLRFLHLFMPDLSWIARLSGSFAAPWAILRTGLMLGSVRRPRR